MRLTKTEKQTLQIAFAARESGCPFKPATIGRGARGQQAATGSLLAYGYLEPHPDGDGFQITAMGSWATPPFPKDRDPSFVR